jgi:radical SAM superfamily enzyme
MIEFYYNPEGNLKKRHLIITPPADDNFFNNAFNVPDGSLLLVNIDALLFGSMLITQKTDVEIYDYWHGISSINIAGVTGVSLFLGYANFKNGLLIRDNLLKLNIPVTLKGIYNFVDGQNFSDCTYLEELGYPIDKTLIDMNITPDYDLLPALGDFFDIQMKLDKPKALALVSEYFGCPKRVNCLHCSSNKFSSEIRKEKNLFKSSQQLLMEMVALENKYNPDFIVITDLMKTKARLKNLCNSYNDLKLNLKSKLRISTAPHFIDTETIEYLKILNCKEVFIGMESFNEHLLKVLDKPFSVADSERALELLYNAGINVHISIMLGIPGETVDTLENTKQFINKWINKKVDNTQFMKLQLSIVTPVPGSMLYTLFKSRFGEAKTKNILKQDNWIQLLQKYYLQTFTSIPDEIFHYYKELSQFSSSNYIKSDIERKYDN